MAIDFVIPWVDGNDPAWAMEKSKFSSSPSSDSRIQRYRDWDNLQYWFRAVEEFAPWVHYVYFITWRHLPTWLNTKHPKLKVILHEDYIPRKFLPTFNVNPIEINIHRIKGISETFVYFNDDMFLTRPVKESDFFIEDIPRAEFTMIPFAPWEDAISGIEFCNMKIINKYFDKKKFQFSNICKIFSSQNNIKQHIHNLLMFPYKVFSAFYNSHLPSSLKRSTFIELWQMEYDILAETSSHKFRDYNDVNQYLFQYWDILKGNWIPRSPNFGCYYDLSKNFEECIRDIKCQKRYMICCNDTVLDSFESKKIRLQQAFKEILPNKSSFEK